MSNESVYCRADFLLFEAQDIGKWFYGILRTGQNDLVDGIVKVGHFDGINAWAISSQRNESSDPNPTYLSNMDGS